MFVLQDMYEKRSRNINKIVELYKNVCTVFSFAGCNIHKGVVVANSHMKGRKGSLNMTYLWFRVKQVDIKKQKLN